MADGAGPDSATPLQRQGAHRLRRGRGRHPGGPLGCGAGGGAARRPATRSPSTGPWPTASSRWPGAGRAGRRVQRPGRDDRRHRVRAPGPDPRGHPPGASSGRRPGWRRPCASPRPGASVGCRGASPAPRAGRSILNTPGLAGRRGGVAGGRARRAARTPCASWPTSPPATDVGARPSRPAPGQAPDRRTRRSWTGRWPGGRHRPAGHLAPALGRRRPGQRGRRRSSRAPPTARPAPTPRSSPCAPPGPSRAAGGATLVCTSSRARTGAGRRRAPTRSIEAGVRRVVVGIVDPDPKVAGAGIGRLRAAGVEVAVGRAGRGGRSAAAALPPPAAQRPALRGAEAGRHARRPDRRARRHQPLDHRPRGPGRRPPAAGGERRRAGRARAPCGPTTRP